LIICIESLFKGILAEKFWRIFLRAYQFVRIHQVPFLKLN